jgi:hypothetical protein
LSAGATFWEKHGRVDADHPSLTDRRQIVLTNISITTIRSQSFLNVTEQKQIEFTSPLSLYSSLISSIHQSQEQ